MSGNEQVKVAFIIHGFDFEPRIVTDILATTPDVAWARGDHVGATGPTAKGVVAKFNHWRIIGEENQSLNIEDHIEPLVSRIEGLADRLRKLPGDSDKKIDVAVYASDELSNPGMYLSPGLLTRIAQLGVIFELSIYFLAQDSVGASD